MAYLNIESVFELVGFLGWLRVLPFRNVERTFGAAAAKDNVACQY